MLLGVTSISLLTLLTISQLEQHQKAGFQNKDSTITMLILFKDSTISLFLSQGQEDGGRWRPMRPLFHIRNRNNTLLLLKATKNVAEIRTEIGTPHCFYSNQQKMLRPPSTFALVTWLGISADKLKSRAIMCILALRVAMFLK